MPYSDCFKLLNCWEKLELLETGFSGAGRDNRGTGGTWGVRAEVPGPEGGPDPRGGWGVGGPPEPHAYTYYPLRKIFPLFQLYTKVVNCETHTLETT